MNIDPELDSWRAEWQAQVDPAASKLAEVRRAALRQQRRLRAAHVLELLTGLFFLAIGAIAVWKVHTFESLLWAVVVWLTTLFASVFSVWNWRVLWKYDLDPVAEFSQVYENRCLAKVRAARFGKGFVIVQCLITGPWLTWDYHRALFSAARFGGAMLWLVLASVGFWVFFSRYRRSALQELHQLRATQE